VGTTSGNLKLQEAGGHAKIVHGREAEKLREIAKRRSSTHMYYSRRHYRYIWYTDRQGTGSTENTDIPYSTLAETRDQVSQSSTEPDTYTLSCR
jgi:hypothetical protein